MYNGVFHRTKVKSTVTNCNVIIINNFEVPELIFNTLYLKKTCTIWFKQREWLLNQSFIYSPFQTRSKIEKCTLHPNQKMAGGLECFGSVSLFMA